MTSVTLGSSGKKARVQTTEANEGQVDMWSSNKQQQSNTRPGVVETQQRRGGEQSKQPGSSQCKMRIGLDWIGLDRLMNGSLSLLMAAQWPPPSQGEAQIQSD